jgi:hypothetical protein
MGSELTDGDSADVAALLQLSYKFGDEVVELKFSLVNCLSQQRRVEHLLNRCDIE